MNTYDLQNSEPQSHHKLISLTSLQILLISILLTGLISPKDQAIQKYTIKRIGLTDAAHTRDDGYQSNYPKKLNESGEVVGHSSIKGSIFLGNSAWFYDGNNTYEIGLTDLAHSNSDGYRFNKIIAMV